MRKLTLPEGNGTGSAARLALYRRGARGLNGFFSRWTGPFCDRCLEVTACAHPGEAGAAMDLLGGRFAGCCQAGVAESLVVPCAGGGVAFPPALAAQMTAARAAAGTRNGPPPGYTLREWGSGRVVEGRGCRHLGAAGCRLGELKAPLCLTYVCSGVRAALEEVAGRGCCGAEEDDFCGAARALGAVVFGPVGEGERQVAALEERLQKISHSMERAGVCSGPELLERWLGRPGRWAPPPPRGTFWLVRRICG